MTSKDSTRIIRSMSTFRILFSVITAVLFITFIVNLLKDRRQFRNALVLFAFLLFLAATFYLYHIYEPMGNTILIFYALFTICLVVIIPFLLIINGFLMIKREGFSIANLLSMAFGILIFAGEFYFITSLGEAGSDSLGTPTVAAFFFGWFVFYISLLFLAFMVYTWFILILPVRRDYDYVIALGCGLLGGERVSRLLSGRLDKAIRVYNRCKNPAKIIVSGGQGPDEKISEAEAMKRYLLEKGIPEANILKEDRSINTFENLRNCKEMIDARGGSKGTAVCTSNYHVLRALIYSKQNELVADGVGSHTAWYYWPSAMIREFAGLCKIYFLPVMFGYLVTAVLFMTILFTG